LKEKKKVGGKIIKGISGGEKKRTSIGIEMISDPSVLILDGKNYNIEL